MTRQPRAVSRTGLYHVVFRGINHCLLFEEQADYEKLLAIIEKVKAELSLEVYAFCLMSNHVHLLLKEALPGDISTAMRKTLTPYALWFNKKYHRSGSLIANRYKSECVESDEYLLTLVRYIHHNPIVAGIADSLESYPWSSYHNYLLEKQTFVENAFVLGVFGEDTSKAVKAFKEFHAEIKMVTGNKSLLDKPRRWEEEIRPELAARYDGLEPSGVAGLVKGERDEVLCFLRDARFSLRQIERATGISKGIIARHVKAVRLQV